MGVKWCPYKDCTVCQEIDCQDCQIYLDLPMQPVKPSSVCEAD